MATCRVRVGRPPTAVALAVNDKYHLLTEKVQKQQRRGTVSGICIAVVTLLRSLLQYFVKNSLDMGLRSSPHLDPDLG